MAQGTSRKIAVYSALTLSIVIVLVIAVVTAFMALPSPETATPVETASASTSTNLPEKTPEAPACDYANLIGKKAEEIDPARLGGHPMRILVPGAMVTMEYLEGRVNVHVDDQGIITSVTCG